MEIKMKKILKYKRQKLNFNETLICSGVFDVIENPINTNVSNLTNFYVSIDKDSRELCVQTTSGISKYSLKEKSEYVSTVNTHGGYFNIYFEITDIDYNTSTIFFDIYEDVYMDDNFIIKDEQELQFIINSILETNLDIKINKEKISLIDKEIEKEISMKYKAIDNSLYTLQEHKKNNLFSCFENTIIHRNIGFLCDDYLEIAISGLYKTDTKLIMNKFKHLFKADFKKVDISNRSDIFKFVFYGSENVKLDRVKTLKIWGINKCEYLNIMNKVIFILNLSNINTLQSNSYEFASINTIEYNVRSFSSPLSIWERTYENDNFNPTAMMYYLSGLNYSNGDFHSFIQAYRAVEAIYQQKIKATDNLDYLLKNNNYQLSTKSIDVQKIIEARDNLVHNESGINFKIVMNDQSELYRDVKNELDSIFRKSLNNKNLKYPATKLTIKNDYVENLYIYENNNKFGEIVFDVKGLDELYKLNELGEKTIMDSNNNEIEFEISKPSIEFKRKNPNHTSEYTLKLKKTKREDFIRNVFEVLCHFTLITLESVNDSKTNDMMYPSIRNNSRIFYTKYNNIRYTKLKESNIGSVVNLDKIHHFNDAIDIRNNTQFENYYMFIQSFFQTKNNFTSHSTENKKIFKNYWNQVHPDVKTIYENKMKSNNLKVSPESAASYFSKFRNNTFHANLEAGQQQLFHIDDEILIQTMMARELCIQLLNDKCIQ